MKRGKTWRRIKEGRIYDVNPIANMKRMKYCTRTRKIRKAKGKRTS
jgi:hypothetical protein